jgi:WW domain
MSVAEAPRAGFAGTPLPPGWTEHRAPTGQPYWYHSYTGMSSWTPPYNGPSGPPAWGRPARPFSSAIPQQRPPEKEKPAERYVFHDLYSRFVLVSNLHNTAKRSQVLNGN